MNLKTLYHNATSISPYRSHYKMPGDPSYLEDIIPNMKTGEICFVFNNSGVTEPTNHLTFISFLNTHFIPAKDIEEPIDENTYYSFSHEGELYYAKKHKLTNTVRVNCSCSDFYFTFSWWNWQRRCLFGKKPMPYTRKTTSYPERNPQHLPGLCKHIYWNLIDLYELDIMNQLI